MSNLQHLIEQERKTQEQREREAQEKQRQEQDAKNKALAEHFRAYLFNVLGQDVYDALNPWSCIHLSNKHARIKFTYEGREWTLRIESSWPFTVGEDWRYHVSIDSPTVKKVAASIPESGERRESLSASNVPHEHLRSQLLCLLGEFTDLEKVHLAQYEAYKERQAAAQAQREEQERQQRELFEQLVAEVKGSQDELQAYVNHAIAEQQQALWVWPKDKKLTVYHWVWFSGHSEDQWDDGWSLSDTADEDGFIYLIPDRVVKLIPEFHKPVISRSVITSVADLLDLYDKTYHSAFRCNAVSIDVKGVHMADRFHNKQYGTVYLDSKLWIKGAKFYHTAEIGVDPPQWIKDALA